MKIGNFNGALTATHNCNSLKISIETQDGFAKYEVADNGNGELEIRKTSDCELIVKPKSDNYIVVI